MRYLSFLFLTICFACQFSSSDDEETITNPHGLSNGHWSFQFVLDSDQNVEVHQHANIDSTGKLVLFNGTESIHTVISSEDSLLYIELPYFNSYLSGIRFSNDSINGNWFRPDRGPEDKIGFSARFVSKKPFEPTQISNQSPQRYAVRFSPGTPNEYPAIGQFFFQDQDFKGTFLTETGDYRFLEGKTEDNEYILQCFDGSHLFHFNFSLIGDSITGVFRSGNSWEEPFAGIKDVSATLRDPFTITKVLTPDPLEFYAMSLDGELKNFSPRNWEGKLTVVQVFGSWCPNCLDESRFLAELKGRYADQPLEVIGLAFERGSDFETNAHRLERYQREVNLPYDLYLGGAASKKEAHKLLPMLSDISSFPTTLVVSPAGKILLIQTGFSGPGTGDEYLKHTQRFEDSLQVYLSQLSLY